MNERNLTCHCRYCGYVLSYALEDAGVDAQCSRCGQTIRLPGRLTKITTMRSGRQKDRLGLASEIAGFTAMFFFFPWGFFAGIGLVYLGWRKSNALFCGSCGAKLKNRELSSCPRCRSKFALD